MSLDSRQLDNDAELDSASADYRDRLLGFWSSHPFWLERGSRRLRKIVVAVLWIIYLLVFYLWLRGHSLVSFIPALFAWVFSTPGKISVVIAAFSFGMLVASSFQLRWAMKKYTDQSLERGSDQRVELSGAAVAAVGLVGFGLPLLLTFAPGIPLELRLLGPLLAFLPVGVLSYLLPTSADRALFPWLTLGILAPLLWASVLFFNVTEWLFKILPLWVFGFFPVLADVGGVTHALTVLAIGVTVFALIRLSFWWRSRKQEPAPPEVTETAPAPAEEGAASADTAWVEELVKAAGVGKARLHELTPGAQETVDYATGSPFELFFDEQKPTLDQHKVLDDFVHLADRALSAARDGHIGTAFEIIVEGPPGSGRSTLLDAISLLSVIGRGARVVLLVPDEGRVGFAIARLRRKLDNLHFTDFLAVDTLQEACRAKQAEQAPPEICVTTPETWETLLAGSLAREGAAFEQVRDLLCLYSTVLVDDWLDHPVEIRAHLPFIIDKHRVLLESEMLPSARVITFPRLGATGRNLAVDRLIGHAGMLDDSRQVARLRYRPELKAMVADIDADAVEETIDRIAAALCQSGRASLLLRKGIDEGEAARQTEEFRTRFSAPAITVCYCNDQVGTITGELSAILMKAAYGPDAVFALRARREEDGIVMIRIRGKRELDAPEVITPLIVDRSGRGMAEAHLLNILRFVKSRTPVPQRSWGQLGLVSTEAPAKTSGRRIGRLLLDRPEDVSEVTRRDRPYLRKLGAYMALDEPFKRFAAVDCHWIPDPGLPFWLSGGDARFGPAELNLPEPVEDGGSSNTTVLWKGNDGAELGRSQLHFTDRLLLKRGQVFSSERLRVLKPSGIQIDAARFRDNGLDFVHPKLETRWQLAKQIGTEPEPPESGYGGPAHGFLWAGSRAPAGHEVSSRLIELTDEFDRPTPCFDFEFRYRSFIRPLLLVPSDKIIESQGEFRTALAALFDPAVEWGTAHPDFLAGLTYAFTRALEADLPSSAFLGKVLVFRLQGELRQFAEAVAWFVEPLGTGTTLSNAVHELLRGDGYLPILAKRMDDILRLGWDKSGSADLAAFWLPRRHRKAILHPERALVGRLRELEEAQRPGQTKPIPRTTETWTIECPSCKETSKVAMHSGETMSTFSHCGSVISLMVPTAGDRWIPPNELLAPWWPEDLREPRGAAKEQVFQVWNAVASRLEYTFDEHQLEGLDECWLPPHETWQRQIGDCEDHSIVIVSMLRKLGIHCWLVWGKTPQGGHAWVELELDGAVYLLEATRKMPLPESLPNVADTDVVLATYGASYTAEEGGMPGRTDGASYDRYENGQWHAHAMGRLVPLVPPPDTKPEPVPSAGETTTES